MSGRTTDVDDDDLRDPALRRALDHAPDHDATPDPRTRDAIRKMAHNLAATPVSAAAPAANSASAAPWWRRLFGSGGEQRARMPWNAAFATVLVAAFVTVLWHREPVPDARLDGEAQVGGAAAPTPVQTQARPAETPPQAQSPSADAAVQPAPAAAQAPAQPARDTSKERRERAVEAPRRSVAPPVVQQEAAPAPEVLSKPQAPLPAQPSPPAPSLASVPVTPAAPAAAEPATTPPLPAMARAREQDEESAKSSRDAEVSGGLRQPAPSRGAAAAKLAAKPSADAVSFAALERWTHFSVARAGVDVRHARGDIEGLPALVSAAALSATTPGAELAAPVEARLALYRGTTLIAVLEIAGNQVRWTPQPGAAASVGTPPPQVLEALRSLLTR